MILKNIIKPYIPYVVREAYHKVNRFYYRTIGTLYRIYGFSDISDTEFLNHTGLNNITEFANYFKNPKNPVLFICPDKQTFFQNLINNNFPESVNSTVNSAEKILKHTFNLLGSGDVTIDEHIDWHVDFKIDLCWPLIHPKGININELNELSDIKIPWELSRFQHFNTLGKAYWYTKNKKYVQEFKRQIENWIIDNPYGLGVNWACTMDISIRACNWILAWYFFKDSPEIDEKFTFSFFKSLFQHGKQIQGNLENKGQMTSNHYISDIVGLLYLGTILLKIKEAKEWYIFAIQELKNEMQKQINPDGMDFEGSTCYHRLVLELFFFSTLLYVINNESFNGDYKETAIKIFGDEYINRLYKMFEFVLYALKPNGKMPQIGDNDNGRLHILSEKDILDMRYLLTFGALFFNEPKFRIKEFGFSEDALWVFRKEGYKRWTKLHENSINNLTSKSFPDSGIYLMRDKGNYIIISCGGNSAYVGGHRHNDVLSFELNIDGQDFIIDPGTYIYTGDYKMRNLFRSSKYHNTLVIDGQEINHLNEKEVFRIANEAKPKVLKWETNEDYDILEAEHYGYQKLSNPIVHRRKFLWDKKNAFLKIEDFLEGEGAHTYEIFFHFPPIPLSLENTTLKTNLPNGPNISIKPEAKEKNKAELKDGWISPSYGIKIKAPYLCYSVSANAPYRFTTIISIINSTEQK